MFSFPPLMTPLTKSKLDGSDILVPATLSKKVMTGLLRQEMGFNGVIVTDALNMKAIADHFGQEEAVVMAVKAGVDIALMPASVTSLKEEQKFARVIQALKEAVKTGIFLNNKSTIQLKESFPENKTRHVSSAKQRQYKRKIAKAKKS